MCGTGSYSIADFKANHALSGATYEFRRVLFNLYTLKIYNRLNSTLINDFQLLIFIIFIVDDLILKAI